MTGMAAKESKKKQYSVAPSALVYLFGDKLGDVLEISSRFALKEKIPCREVKVAKKDLTTSMFAVAFIYLNGENHLNLTVDKKGLVFKSDAVFAAFPPQRSKENLDGLERQIIYNITEEKNKDDVKSIIKRILGKDSHDPWGQVIKEMQEYLTTQDYFAKEERGGIAKILGRKTTPQCEKIAELETEVQQVREMVAAFKSSQPNVYKLLWKNIAAGIKSRQISDDY
jgi:hypothetical protein